MKFCPVVPESCRGQVHASRKERIRIKNNNKKRSKNNKSPKLCLGDLIIIKIIIRNGAKTISLQTLFRRLNKNNNKKRNKNFWEFGRLNNNNRMFENDHFQNCVYF